MRLKRNKILRISTAFVLAAATTLTCLTTDAFASSTFSAYGQKTDDVKQSFAQAYGWDLDSMDADTWTGLDGNTYTRTGGHQVEAFNDLVESSITVAEELGIDMTEYPDGDFGGGAFSSSPYAERIFEFLMEILGNEYAVCGLMANLQCESRMRPNNMQDSFEGTYNDESYTAVIDSGEYSRDDFIGDSIGYGLAQWTYSTRKAALYDLAKSQGKSISDIDVQLELLARELNSFGLIGPSAGMTDLRAATLLFVEGYERPAGSFEEKADERLPFAKGFYDAFVLGLGPGGGVGGGDYGGSEGVGGLPKVAEVASNSSAYGVYARGGLCLAWVAQVYSAAGYSCNEVSTCCAYNGWLNAVRAGHAHDGTDGIVPGAVVFGTSPGGAKATHANHGIPTCGHVGIYIGNGTVVSAVGDNNARADSLSAWWSMFGGLGWSTCGN